MGSPRIGVIIDGKLTVHADSENGNYDTLCGIDANDNAIGHQGFADAGRRRIGCSDCKAIWRRARQYRARDFRS